MKTEPHKEMLDAMHKDPSNWKGLFYMNRKDPRLVVPKLYPLMGWTLNFANPWVYLVLLGLAGLILISQWLI